MGVRLTLLKQKGDYVVVEGAMGFYDGVNGTDRASAWRVARTANLPVVLAIRPGGQPDFGRSGQGTFDLSGGFSDSWVGSYRLSALSLHPLGAYFGRRDRTAGFGLPPSHGGGKHWQPSSCLLTPGEIADLNQRFRKVAEQLERQ